MKPAQRLWRRAAMLAITAAAALVASGLTYTLAPSAAAAVTPAATATAISSGSTYTVANSNSGKCVDAKAAATANGTAVQQYSCNSTGAQQWRFTATNSGYFQIGNANSPAQVWDVTNVSAADSALIQLWTYGGGNNQQWLPVAESTGGYHFVNRNSGKCLDVPSASTADSAQLQQYTCNGTAAQSFTLALAGGTPPAAPDLGPNVLTFDPSMSSSTIQSQLDNVYNQQQTNQFGGNRYALLFKPGSYNVNVNVGFYTQVLGLGQSPNATTITGGGVNADAAWAGGNATQNFWRSAENLTISPSSGSTKWAVSQASPMRRVHVTGSMVLDDNGGWSSGGFLGDSVVNGQVNSGTQQQWLSRSDQWGSWTGSNWNMVFVGDTNAPAQSFPNPPYTTVAQVPTIAEKPFLYVDQTGAYQVFVPADRTNTQGSTWNNTVPAGTSLPISQFYIAKPADTAATINTALASGKNLLFTPGVYHLTDTIRVTRPDTVVLGLGLATLEADNGVTAMSTADVNGIRIGGLLFDAGTTNSPVLLQVGPSGSNADHSADPTVLSDVFARVGGAAVGKATVSVQVNSNNVIGDDLWLWRADHGSGVGWTSNIAANGLVVNGTNVTMYGLAVEHYQQYSVVWNGNGGRTYFFQNELPYDPPNQASWMNGSTQGYAAYKVADSVTSHEAWGVGSYCYFSSNPSVVADRAFEVPYTSGVRFHDLVTVSLGGVGTISHIINSTGGPSNSSNSVAYLANYP
ncbi:RICIN domain-containing protein [Actinacidiphila soli]|uniref:RICIN domain-containing protein n=1 Tax=Actinacidiphila soli TaxID=2487275 RepID=UPI001F0B9C96|nr:RICIN domain-containing protein [Actinacidiphila soli]